MKAILLPAFLLIALNSGAQTFNSGSTGADGALILTTPGTFLFNPADFNPRINPSGDNVYQFTSIYIGRDVTVKLSSKFLNGPLFWLAQGPVEIDGTIDLDGGDGSNSLSIAGAGGFPGGTPQKSGFGDRDKFKLNAFLVPLVGGLGGRGGITQGGGAGGGALLIASSASITINGSITANGGATLDGTGGDGGAIRLVAPIIDGSGGNLTAKGGPTLYGEERSQDGRVRFETFENRYDGEFNNTPFSQGKPFGLFLPPSSPSARFVSIGGNPVSNPEITLKQSISLIIEIEGKNIPLGTPLELQCFSDDGANATTVSTPLAGAFEKSLAKASLVFPQGLSHCTVNANWEQPPLQRK